MARFYWAVRPKSEPTHIRIERAKTAQEACRLAFGRPMYPELWEVKNLGSRIAVIQSDNKRMALLRDPTGWVGL